MENELYNPRLRLLTVEVSKELEGWWNLSNLSAPYWRLYWNNAPGAFIKYNGLERSLTPEKLMLIAPNTNYNAAAPNSGCARQFFIHFLAGSPYSEIENKVLEFPLKADQNLKSQLENAFKEILDNTCGNRRKSLLALRLVIQALELLPEELLKEKLIDPRIASAIEALAMGYSQQSNEELAKKAGMSANAFLRLFRKDTGDSPQLYSRRHRIEEACMLLHYSQLDIKNIAAHTGFCDRYHFSRVFKALRGMTPAEFRRKSIKS